MNPQRTMVPGMDPQQTNRQTSPFGPGAPTMGQATEIPGVNATNAPKGQLFGFLYSVSKSMAGEYWPLYLGSNTIGRGRQNSIILDEMTVSDIHAGIHIISRSNKLIVYIKDDQSKTGTLLNGELLRGEADLKMGDVVTIGEHYELYVILFNPIDLGLGVVEGFTAAPAMPPFGPQFGPQAGFGATSGPAATQPRPNATVVDGQAGPAPVGGHTVIMGGPKF